MREAVETKEAPAPIGPYSQAIKTEGLVFVSGQIPVCPRSGKMLEGIAAQTHQAIKNIAAVLEAAGSGLDRVVKITAYLTNLDDFAAFNDVYREYFSESKPARATVEVSRLPKGALVEIDAIASMSP